jgi:hypothetical protein
MSAQDVSVVSGGVLLVAFALAGLYLRRRHGRYPHQPPDSKD